MNVIFIGPDGAGKTTISQLVAKELGYSYFKPDKEDLIKVDKTWQYLATDDTVFDRMHFPDEVVYSFLRSSEYCTDKPYQEFLQHMKEFEEIAKTNGKTLYVFVDASMYTLQKRLEERGDVFIKPSDLHFVQAQYHFWLNRTKIPFLTTSTEEALDSLVKRIKESLEEIKNNASVSHSSDTQH